MATYNKQQFAAAYTNGVRQLMDIYDDLVALGYIGNDLGYTGENNVPGANPIADEDMASACLNPTAADLYGAMAVLSGVKASLEGGVGRAALNALRR